MPLERESACALLEAVGKVGVIPEEVGRAVDYGEDDKLDYRYPVYRVWLLHVVRCLRILGSLGGGLLASFLYSEMSCAIRLLTAARMQDCIVTVIIGDDISRMQRKILLCGFRGLGEDGSDL